jgi:hypothetical protein
MEGPEGALLYGRRPPRTDAWGLWKNTATGYGSVPAPSGWTAEPNPEPRPTLGAGIPGSGMYAFAQYADLFSTTYGSEFRGRAGAFWDT